MVTAQAHGSASSLWACNSGGPTYSNPGHLSGQDEAASDMRRSCRVVAPECFKTLNCCSHERRDSTARPQVTTFVDKSMWVSSQHCRMDRKAASSAARSRTASKRRSHMCSVRRALDRTGAQFQTCLQAGVWAT